MGKKKKRRAQGCFSFMHALIIVFCKQVRRTKGSGNAHLLNTRLKLHLKKCSGTFRKGLFIVGFGLKPDYSKNTVAQAFRPNNRSQNKVHGQ